MNTTQGVSANEVSFRKIDIPVGECVQRGWDLAIQNLGPFIGYTVLVLAIHAALAVIPILGWIGSWVISPALSAGYFTYIRKKLRNEPAVFQDFFEGFQYVGPLFLVGLVGEDLLIRLGCLDGKILFLKGLKCCLLSEFAIVIRRL